MFNMKNKKFLEKGIFLFVFKYTLLNKKGGKKMAIETLKENLCVNQIVGKAKENIVVEGDVIIPDIKPDILSSINTCGNVCIYKKEVLDGKLRIEGGVQVYIMYLADDESSVVRGINTVIDFSKTIDMENVNPSMTIEGNICLKDIECKILNGRKINVKANLEAQISVYSNENIEFIKEIENADDIQVLNTVDCIDSLLGTGNTKVYAKDTLNIDSNDNLSEIIKCNISISNKEIKTSYNKILVKADLEVSLVYLTEDNRVNEANCKIPVMGFIDMQNITDDNICNVNFEIKNILLKPNSTEEHSIFIEVELEIFCNVYEKKEIEIIQDLYSPTQNLSLGQKNITVMKDKNEVKDVVSIKENLNIPELKGSRLCNVEVLPKILKESIYNDKIAYEGELVLKFMYISNVTNRVDIKVQNVPFTATVSANGISNNSNLNTNIEVLTQNFTTMSDESIEMNVELQINSDISKMMEIKVIDNIEVLDSDDENIYSIVVYFVKPGDTLWNIAKRFKSTIKAISTVNGIEDENNISIGQQLFIPKFV